MSGRDAAIACLLGAEEFGFATAPLVAMGCMMMRVCNLDPCPVGIAIQNPELRKRFAGKPGHVENFMCFIVRELREIMARRGVRTVDEMVGRTELLRPRRKRVTIDFAGAKRHFDPDDVYDFHLEKTLDESVLLRTFEKSLKKGRPQEISLTVSSTDRTLGTILGSVITRQYGNTLPEDTYVVRCQGGGGQSLGAFIPKWCAWSISPKSTTFRS